ncbi:type I polyketide synthase [Mangrovihabitans endophyticus]|uniref:Acyl transferase domain-containing protein n=1 Tax=Mangrovihabitans endophyticus TaxID=1751298 RepID=A0A8J3BTF4_9ACTN|nr:type I polyketide synthase [Mangrovihabitans endophyticus]GGK75415.1 hypothetical protein GCM10012284_06770 [Mangrovihabitans endophyticus]
MSRPFQPVAVVAATCLLPGARTLEDLWRLFDAEGTAIGEIPPDRLDRSIYYSPDPRRRNTSPARTAALLGPWEFSTRPKLPPRQAMMLDPTHRMAIEVGQRIIGGLESRWLPRQRTGVWVANTSGAIVNQLRMVSNLASERWARHAAALRPELAERIAGFQDGFRARNPHPREDGAISGNILSGRMANYFDLRGPQMSLDAACASSMAGLRAAAMALEAGTVDMALVAAIGVQCQEQFVVQSKARAIAVDPSFPFDRDAAGFIPGEGAIMVALVRAEDAEPHDLPVLGVIRSIGAGLNGRGTSAWSPSESAERQAITRAWDEAEFSPDGPDGGMDYIEAHGTATQVGDRIEHAAMLATYGKASHAGPIPFGSVKSVVGHLVEGAGLAGVLRALYLFDTGHVPASVGVREPADYVTANADRLRLARHRERLAPGDGRPRRVGVSSFGVGGVNYHAIIESRPDRPMPPRRGAPSTPIAVVGLSGIMPEAPDTAAVWEQLRAGAAVRRPLRRHIPDFDLYQDPDASRRDRTVCPTASIVERPVLGQPVRWRVTPKHAAVLFSDHVLLLNAATALADAGVVPASAESRARSGVYITDVMDGDSRNDVMATLVFERWWHELRSELGETTAGALDEQLRADPVLRLRAVSADDSMAGQGVQGATRVAAGLGLDGQAIAVNSACASGLAAMDMAIRELRAGALDFALVGGASLAVDEANQVALSAIGSLSATGSGRPYDERADGFVIGSGAVWLAVKRLTDAERDGDRVLAVIRECAGTSDGRGRSLLAPSREGRRDVIRETFERAGIEPGSVQYVEGHGAANVLGDSSELEAIGLAMGTPENPVRVGSIKGNYGHLKGPAALAGLMKVILALRARTFVPTPGFVRGAELPHVDGRLVRVVDRGAPWPPNRAGQPRRASVNAFGLGGTNFHLIVDEYRPDEPSPASSTPRIGAASAAELAEKLHTAEQTAEPDAAWRAAVFVRESKAQRAVRGVLAGQVTAAGSDDASGMSDSGGWSAPGARTGPVAAMFPGQAGTEHFDAVAWLCAASPDGAQALDLLETRIDEPGRRIAAALRARSLDRLGDLRRRSGTSQLLGLLASVLTVRRLSARHGSPLIHLGHSAGEFAALVAAGSIDLSDAVRLVWRRGILAEEETGGRAGLMAAVFTSSEQAEELVAAEPDAYVSTVNGPRLCVIGGWADPVRRVLARAASAGLRTAELDIALPFHTPLLAGAVPKLRAELAGIEVRPPRMPVYAAALGATYPDGTDPDVIRDCVAALYTRPVRLDHLLRRAHATGVRRFVECGTGRSLCKAVTAVHGTAPHLAVAGVLAAAEGFDRIDAALWVAGVTDAGHPPSAFQVHTPVTETSTKPVPPWPGEPWLGTSVTVAGVDDTGPARQWLDGLSRRLSEAGATVRAAGIAELSTGAAGAADRVPVPELAAALAATAGPRWLFWVAPPTGTVVPARTMAELACLRAAVRGLAEGWEAGRPGGLVVVTSLDGRLGDTVSLLNPAGGGYAGFVRALAQEYPRASVTLVDVGRDVGAAAGPATIVRLGRPPAGRHETGLGATGMSSTRLAALPVGPDEPQTEATALLGALREPDAAIVVSGGTTGIVAQVLLAAARRSAVPLPGRLVLVSRTAPGAAAVDPEAELTQLRSRRKAELLTWRRAHPGATLHDFERHWKRLLHAAEGRVTLHRLRECGVDARHVVADVCDGRQTRALGEQLRMDGLRMRTILHGAGIERSSRIIDKPAAEWEDTVAVKLLGLHHLVAAAGDDLRLLVAYGSVSGSLGLPGQTDYSAANEYLAAAITRLRAERPGLVAQYLGWPAWDEVGLAADAGVKRKLQDAMGLRYLTPQEGARWALSLTGQAATLPPRLIVLPRDAPPLLADRVAPGEPPARRWWLVDSITRRDGGTRIRRCYDTADPRDAELTGHRVRGNIRVAAVQIVEQFAEAYAAARGIATGPVELCDVAFRQGLVTGRRGRRPVTVDVVDGPDGEAALRLSTVPLLDGDLPGPGTVLLATATGRTPPAGAPREHVDVGSAVPAGQPIDLLELAALFGIAYSGRFATAVTPLRHPEFAVAGTFQPGPAPPRAGACLSDPAAVDTALRTVAAAADGDETADRGLPSAIERLVLHTPARDAGPRRYAFVRARPGGGYDVLFTDAHGDALTSLYGLRLQTPSDHSGTGVSTARSET